MKRVKYFFLVAICFISLKGNSQSTQLEANFGWEFSDVGYIKILDFELYADIEATHEWYILSSTDYPATSYTPVFSGYSIIPAPFTLINNAQPDLYYLTIHKVYSNNNEEACDWLITNYSKNTQNETIDACELVNQYWPNGPDDNEVLSTFSTFININFEIYPNPAENRIQIISKTKIKNIYIYNVFGKLVVEKTNLNQIDVSNLKQGLYFVKVQDVNGNIAIKKIIKKQKG